MQGVIKTSLPSFERKAIRWIPAYAGMTPGVGFFAKFRMTKPPFDKLRE